MGTRWCLSCGSKYDDSNLYQEFRDWAEQDGWRYCLDEVMPHCSLSYCLECNKNKLYSEMTGYERCLDCDNMFNVDEAKSYLRGHIQECHGYEGSDLDDETELAFNDNCCGHCNALRYEEYVDSE